MLITDKKNRSYAYVSLDDILLAIESSSQNDSVELKKLFNSFDYENDKIRISKSSRVYGVLKNNPKIIDGDTYINPTMLAGAFTRASLEFNYEMKDRLFKYLKKYIDNMAENKSNESLVQKILCDDLVMEYIHRYDSFEDYTKHIIGTRIKKYTMKKHTMKKQEVKSKSFVRIAA